MSTNVSWRHELLLTGYWQYKNLINDKIKCDFFQVVAVSVLLYGCTTWIIMKCLKKKLNGNYTKMLCAVLNKSWKQHPTKQQLYGYLAPISQTIQVRQTTYRAYYWKWKDEHHMRHSLMNPYIWMCQCWPTNKGLHQLCAATGCRLEDLPRAMDNRDGWWESQWTPCYLHDLMMMMMILVKYILKHIVFQFRLMDNNKFEKTF